MSARTAERFLVILQDHLPDDLELEKRRVDYEKENNMLVLSPFEKRAIKKGHKEGVKKATESIAQRLLEKRFGAIPDELVKRMEKLNQTATETLCLDLLDFDSIDDLQAWLDERENG